MATPLATAEGRMAGHAAGESRLERDIARRPGWIVNVALAAGNRVNGRGRGYCCRASLARA